MKKIQVIVIDDERSAREELKMALKEYADFEVIAEARNADEAREQIIAKHPDLIFLDIQMPEKTGFDLLESLNEVPAVIFTTAFNEYAVQAFEVNALDYLMKPIRQERFVKTIEKIRNSINQRSFPDKTTSANRQLFIKEGEKCYFVRLSDIHLIESVDNYSRLYFEGKKVLLKRSLRQWEEMLEVPQFFRINRTHIINTHNIQQVHILPKSKLKISLKTGELLEVSSRQSAKFRSLHDI
jgi:two-component system LytT family response regulator